MFFSEEQSLALIGSLPQAQKRLLTHNLKNTSFLASQKQQGWERSEEEEHRLWI